MTEFNRVFEGCEVHVGTFTDEIPTQTEDGEQGYRSVSYVGIIASTTQGAEYDCTREFKTVRGAAAYVRGLWNSFNPKDHSDFRFNRNQYGSQAYQSEDMPYEALREREDAAIFGN